MKAKAKRPHQLYKTPMAILDYMQSALSQEDHHDLQECIFEHDRHLTKTQHEATKHCSDSFLYTKSCGVIFSDLRATLFLHCEFLHAVNKCLDVSLLVEQIMANETCDAGKAKDVEAATEMQKKTERLAKGVSGLTQHSAVRMRLDKEVIANTNSQLRFALRYKTLARILHLSRGEEAGGLAIECAAEASRQHDSKSNVTPDARIDDELRSSAAYETLKNKCMLGAIIQYTVRSKERLRVQRSGTKIGGVRADTVARLASIESDMVKKAVAMLQTTHCLHEKRERIAIAMRKTLAENVLLQTELDSVRSRIKQMHK